MLTDPSDICQALVGLKGVEVVSFEFGNPVSILTVESVTTEVACPRCGDRARLKDRHRVQLADLAAFDQDMAVVLIKHRLACLNPQCSMTTWTHQDHRVSAKGVAMTTRAAKAATRWAGDGDTITAIARRLHVGWDAANHGVMVYGQALLAADKTRLKTTAAIGLDETSFVRLGQFRTKTWVTTVADVQHGQLIDVLPGRDYVEVAQWLRSQPARWQQKLRCGALDMSDTYAAAYSVALPGVDQVVDPFHVVKLATRVLDEVRCRVQVEQHGHRGRKDNALYKSRKLLVMGAERLDETRRARLATLLELGDPHGEVALAHGVKEAIRGFYREADPDTARGLLEAVRDRCLRPEMSFEIRRLGRTLKKWFTKITAWHQHRISNGPTEGMNNLQKRIKRSGFGYRKFANYRIRVLLYAGKPTWRTLDSIVVR